MYCDCMLQLVFGLWIWKFVEEYVTFKNS